MFSQSPGLQPVQVWSDKDLLQSWSGSLFREAAPGPTTRGLCYHPETRPRVEPEKEVPAHETGHHRHTTVHPRNTDNTVRSIHCFLSSCLDLLGFWNSYHHALFVKNCSKSVSAATLKQGWATLVIQRHWRGYRMRQIYHVVRLASITIQAFTRGWLARKCSKKVCTARMITSFISKINMVRIQIHLYFRRW